MQMMMRQQGSLYLAAALCASLEGRGARERLTLALRHYERALAPQLLAQAAVSPAMERCAAEARLELANFYLTWGTMSGGEQVKHLEAALSHARAPQKTEGLPIDVVAPLVDAEERALRELIRAHAANGNASRSAALKEEYRAVLQRKAASK